MDVRAARRLVDTVAKHRSPRFAGDLKVLVTPDAGHYPAIDQPLSVLRQLATACESYLPPAAKEALLAAAARQPPHRAAKGDSSEELERELERNPLQAAAHEASEL